MKVEITDSAEKKPSKNFFLLYPEEVANRIIGDVLGRAETLSKLQEEGALLMNYNR